MCVLSLCSCAGRFPKCSSKSAASAASLSCPASSLAHRHVPPVCTSQPLQLCCLTTHLSSPPAGNHQGVCVLSWRKHTHTHTFSRPVCLCYDIISDFNSSEDQSELQSGPTHWDLLAITAIYIGSNITAAFTGTGRHSITAPAAPETSITPSTSSHCETIQQ